MRLPEGMTADGVRRRLERDHSVAVSSGRGDWAYTYLRIGHMGWVSSQNIRSMTIAIEHVLTAERAGYGGLRQSRLLLAAP